MENNQAVVDKLISMGLFPETYNTTMADIMVIIGILGQMVDAKLISGGRFRLTPMAKDTMKLLVDSGYVVSTDTIIEFLEERREDFDSQLTGELLPAVAAAINKINIMGMDDFLVMMHDEVINSKQNK